MIEQMRESYVTENNGRRKGFVSKDSISHLFEILADSVGILLSAEATPATLSELKGLEASLAFMTTDKIRRPQIYDEIEKIYIKGVHNTRSRFPRSPNLSQAHLTDEYRLAWEYYLLQPEASNFAPLYKDRVTRAIGYIKNDSSLNTLLQVYELTTQPEVKSSQVENLQKGLLASMSMYGSPDALRTILKCMDLSKKYSIEKSTEERSWEVEDYVLKLLTEKSNYGNENIWGGVIPGITEDILILEHKNILDTIQRKLRDD